MMMAPWSNEALLQTLDRRYPCRELQIRQLAHLLWPAQPSLPVMVVHGLEATGKSTVVMSLLDAVGVPHAVIKSQECITARHLLERTVSSCEDALAAKAAADGEQMSRQGLGRCESLSVLAVHLQKLLEGRSNFVLVFDGIDRQREAPPTLLQGLARLGDFIANLSIVMILTSPRPRFLHRTGAPHVHFPPYNKLQALTIVSGTPRQIFEPLSTTSPPPSPCPTDAEDSAWVWSRFCSAVWDSLGKGAARDIVSFRAVCDRLWRPFVAPIVNGLYGTRDFSKLMVARRGLFQSEDALVEEVVPREVGEGGGMRKSSHDLPFYSKHLLCAAYLASYNPARQDQIFFMKSSEKKRRKKGGGAVAGRGAKHRKIQRRLLGPQAFPMERMLAIFHAIVPYDVASTVDLQTQIATLASLRLLVRTSASADVLEASTKWRVNVGWDYIRQLARTVKFEIDNHIAE